VRFEGIHHITCITADAPGNVDFYVRVLGLRLVKKSVNQDDPTVYHLFYADEKGSAGSDLTFFEYPHARRGRAGRGMVHTIVFRVGSADALDFWADRLEKEEITVERADGRISFEDPEGLRYEIAHVETNDEPLIICEISAHHFGGRLEPGGAVFTYAKSGTNGLHWVKAS
jgi:glyoxalase family protein